MYEILKAIAAANGWGLYYARDDYKNLFTEIEDKSKVQIFLDPVIIKENYNDTNVIESKTYSGGFVIALSSNLDEDSYDARYQAYIKPLKSDSLPLLRESIRCGYDVDFGQWETTEVINILDYNLDGLLVKYNLTIDE